MSSRDTALTSAAGFCLGSLLGLLLGLSGTPVVAAVVGALVAAAAGYWSASQPPKPADGAAASPSSRARLTAAIALSLASILGMSAGLWLRAHDVFARTPAQQIRMWRDAGFSDADAQAIVALNVAGLVKPGYSAQPGAVNATRSSVLFAAHVDECQQLNPEDLQGAANLRTAFTHAGGRWAQLAKSVARADETTQRDALAAAWELACR